MQTCLPQKRYNPEQRYRIDVFFIFKTYHGLPAVIPLRSLLQIQSRTTLSR